MDVNVEHTQSYDKGHQINTYKNRGRHAEEEDRPCHYNVDGKGKKNREEKVMLVSDSKALITQKEQNVWLGSHL